MTKIAKLIEKMRHNPRDWRIAELETVARHYGLTATRPGKGGSHVTFRAENGEKLTVPDHKPIKPIYVTLFLKWIEELSRHDQS